MLYYYLGYYYKKIGMFEKALEFYRLCMTTGSDYCFPNRLEYITVLLCVQKLNPEDAKTIYYLDLGFNLR